jgi:5-methylcytosine-specific restriction enzyme A
MKRRRLSRIQRMRVFDSAGGNCCLCGSPIATKLWVCEHLTPLAMGGADDESNMGPAHECCADEKTCREALIRAKVYRQRQKHIGVKKRQARPMMGTVASGWKRTFSNGWVRR